MEVRKDWKVHLAKQAEGADEPEEDDDDALGVNEEDEVGMLPLSTTPLGLCFTQLNELVAIMRPQLLTPSLRSANVAVLPATAHIC